MKMFDIGNLNKIGFWVCARNEKVALKIALEHRHIKDAKNGRIHNVTIQALRDDKTGTLEKILSGKKEGQLVFQGVSYSFSEILNSAKKEPKGWMIIDRVE